ncbi:MAG TPA: hypothetical protein VNV88_14810 [Candidatus Solibacter sp.]|nr:hypothetical protein [Candidatus Solibacter sp.]
MAANSICKTTTQRRPAKIALVTFVLFASGSLALAQSGSRISGQAGMHGGTSASGTLSVTATVVTSVGVIIGPDGEPKLVVANATDAADNFSQLRPVSDHNELHVKTSGECTASAGQQSLASGSCGELTVQPRAKVTSTHIQ